MIKVKHAREIELLVNVSEVEGEIAYWPKKLYIIDATLKFIECKPEEAMLFNGSLGYMIYDISYGLVKGLGKYLKPVFISESEIIYDGDWYMNGNHIYQADRHYERAENDRKVLALPKHFSLEQLHMVVTGKLKEGSHVIECEFLANPVGENGKQLHVGSTTLKIIKLDPHITIHIGKTISDNNKINNIIRHIKRVEDNCYTLAKKLQYDHITFALQLIKRGRTHDISKFDEYEFQYLGNYESEKPKEFYEALKIHHAKNQHHPEYWGINGIHCMSELDLAEMVCDCVARGQEFGTDTRKWFAETATEKYGFKMEDRVGQTLTRYLNLLLDKSF